MTGDPWARTTLAVRCIECLVYVVEPTEVAGAVGQPARLYVCPCGATWPCNWSVGAVEGWDVLGEDAAA